jgi:hypothetical protein
MTILLILMLPQVLLDMKKPLPKNIEPLASLNVEDIACISLSNNKVCSTNFGKFLKFFDFFFIIFCLNIFFQMT